jgi:predicted HAD superfamily Cof-like phosphohydrolase
MNTSIFQRVAKFNKDAGTKLFQKNLSLVDTQLELDMLQEEMIEFKKAMEGYKKYNSNTWVNCKNVDEQRVEIADALADIIYVAMGTMSKLGMDYEKIMEEVCTSNESKYTNGKLLKNEHGKIMKGSNFRKPDLSFVSKVDRSLFKDVSEDLSTEDSDQQEKQV